MAPKGRKPATAEPSPAATPNKDVHQRLNFLYQASILLGTAVHARPSWSRPPKALPRADDEQNPSGPPFLVPTQPGIFPARPILPSTARALRPLGTRGDSVGAVGGEKGQGPKAGTAGVGEGNVGGKKKKRRPVALGPVSRSLVKTMKEVAKKATIRMDPSVKRTLCKGCGAVLVPGVTCVVRVKPSGPHAHLIMTTCLGCRRQLRLPAPPHLPPSLPPPADPTLQTDMDTEVEESAAGPQTLPGAAPESRRRKSKRERREARQARRPVFFEREGHVTFASTPDFLAIPTAEE